jgi:hypothetical protein
MEVEQLPSYLIGIEPIFLSSQNIVNAKPVATVAITFFFSQSICRMTKRIAVVYRVEDSDAIGSLPYGSVPKVCRG